MSDCVEQLLQLYAGQLQQKSFPGLSSKSSACNVKRSGLPPNSKSGSPSHQAYQQRRNDAFREKKGKETMEMLDAALRADLLSDNASFENMFQNFTAKTEQKDTIMGFTAMAHHITSEDDTINTLDVKVTPKLIEPQRFERENEFIGTISNLNHWKDEPSNIILEPAKVINRVCEICSMDVGVEERHECKVAVTISGMSEPESPPNVQRPSQIHVPPICSISRSYDSPKKTIYAPLTTMDFLGVESWDGVLHGRTYNFKFYRSEEGIDHLHHSVLFPYDRDTYQEDSWLAILDHLDCASRFKIFSNVPYLAYQYGKIWGRKKCTCTRRCAVQRKPFPVKKKFCLQPECDILCQLTVLDYLQYLMLKYRICMWTRGRRKFWYPPRLVDVTSGGVT